MLKIETWKPDTCLCVFEYTTDDSAPIDQIEMLYHKVLKVCDKHQGLSGQELFEKVLFGENRLKNNVVTPLAYDILASKWDMTQIADQTVKDILKEIISFLPAKEGNEVIFIKGENVIKSNPIKYRFDENRNLEIDVSAFSAGKKAEVDLFIADKFLDKNIIVKKV